MSARTAIRAPRAPEPQLPQRERETPAAQRRRILRAEADRDRIASALTKAEGMLAELVTDGLSLTPGVSIDRWAMRLDDAWQAVELGLPDAQAIAAQVLGAVSLEERMWRNRHRGARDSFER